MSERKVSHRRMRIWAGVAGIAVTLTPMAGLAKDEKSKAGTPAALQPLKACQAETDPTARLACYDRVTAQILAASEEGELRVVNREDVKKTRRSLFGFALPDFGIFGGKDEEDGPDKDEIKVLNTTVQKVAPTRDGGYLVTTAEGAVWQIDSPPSRLMSPKVGQSLEIRNAALTSYFLRINGQNGVKGVRVR